MIRAPLGVTSIFRTLVFLSPLIWQCRTWPLYVITWTC